MFWLQRIDKEKEKGSNPKRKRKYRKELSYTTGKDTKTKRMFMVREYKTDINMVITIAVSIKNEYRMNRKQSGLST